MIMIHLESCLRKEAMLSGLQLLPEVGPEFLIGIVINFTYTYTYVFLYTLIESALPTLHLLYAKRYAKQ